MKSVIIEMDQCFTWWPRDIGPHDDLDEIKPIHLSDEFLKEFEEISKKYQEYQEYLEKSFRSQRGLPPR